MGGCTDNTIGLARKYLKNLKCPYYIKQIEEPHDEYFLNHHLEPHTFNMWHEDLKDYDWIIHLDADEIYSPSFRDLLYHIKNNDVQFNGVYTQVYQIVGSPDRAVWKLNPIDIPCPIPNHPYHPLRRNTPMRLYKISEWFYPTMQEMGGQDTFPHPKNKHNAVYIDAVKILHVKFLFPKFVRMNRSQKNYIDPNYEWCNEENEYVTVNRGYIPDILMEFYDDCVEKNECCR